MYLKPSNGQRGLPIFLAVVVAIALLMPTARAASCKTQSQLPAGERDALANTVRVLMGEVQSGDTQALRTNTIPAVAANFGGIAASIENLKPSVQHATVTIDNLYALDASSESAAAVPTSFYCGSPVVALNFTNLPPGKYALAIVHATGVSKPQQISLILSQTADNRWMLAGFFTHSMVEAGHDGLWYWVRARDYAQKKMDWNAWFYYQAAAALLDPVPFLSSPNLVKLHQEADEVRPIHLPGVKPMMLNADGTTFAITSMGITGELGGMDLEVHYTPDAAQLTQLRDPVAARKQAVTVMTALVAQHPELRLAFRGLWVRVDQGAASIYALELPMSQIAAAGVQPSPAIAPVQETLPQGLFDPTKPETQPGLDRDRDPVPSPDMAEKRPFVAGTASTAGAGHAGEIQKGKGGIYTLHEDVNEVVLNCTVIDGKGRLVRGLKRGDFHVWEDGVPQTIESFRFQDLPVSMGILVDNSGSMRDKRAVVDKAALDLVRASNPSDAAFIVNFSDKAYLDQGFTSNISLLERGLSHFDARNMTALYDAVVASADELAQHAKQPKQVLLIITDGGDDASRLTLQQAVRRVQRLGGPVVYSIGLLYGDDKAEAERARTALETLSADTGGVAYFPPSLQDVDEIAGQVARDIRDQYSVGYHSTKPAKLGGYRTVRVEAKAPKHGKLIVRTRKGYYPKAAPPIQPKLPAQTAQSVAPTP